MKKSHLILSAIILVSVIAVGFNSTQEKKYEYATVKTYETYNNDDKSSVTIVYPEEPGRSRRNDMEKLNIKNFAPNQEAISDVLNQMGGFGWKLISTNSSGASEYTTTTYILIRE